MKVINKVENDNLLLSRKEYALEVEFEGSAPTKADVKETVCKELKLKENMTVVRKVDTSFKSNVAKCDVFSYSDEAEMKRIEHYLMHKKIEEKLKAEEEARAAAEEAKKAEEEAKKAEEAAAAKETSEDKPAEEAKEE